MTDTPEGPVWRSPTGAGRAEVLRAGRPLPPPGTRPVAPVAPPTEPLAPPKSSARPPSAVSSGLARTLQGFFWAMCVLSVVALLLVVGNLLAFSAWWDTPIGSLEAEEALDDWVRAEDVLQAVGGVMLLVGLVLFVLLLVWSHTAHTASQQLWAGERRWSSGWSVGGWFIPLANAVIPKLVLDEVERIACAPRSAGRVDEDYRSTPTSAVGWVWWLAAIAGGVLNLVGNGLGSGPDSSAAEVRLGYAFNAVGLTAGAISMACGAVFVARLTSRLTIDGLREQS